MMDKAQTDDRADQMALVFDALDGAMFRAQALYDRGAQTDDPKLRADALIIINNIRAVRKLLAP